MRKLNRRQIRNMLLREMRNIRLDESAQPMPNDPQKVLEEILGDQAEQFMANVGMCVMTSMGQKTTMQCAIEEAKKMFKNAPETLEKLLEALQTFGLP